jgi:hypothetical protein
MQNLLVKLEQYYSSIRPVEMRASKAHLISLVRPAGLTTARGALRRPYTKKKKTANTMKPSAIPTILAPYFHSEVIWLAGKKASAMPSTVITRPLPPGEDELAFAISAFGLAFDKRKPQQRSKHVQRPHCHAPILQTIPVDHAILFRSRIQTCTTGC